MTYEYFCRMLLFAFSFAFYLIPMSSGKTRRPVIKDPLGERGFDTVWTYLDYEEPPFNYDEGLTADYFTDDYAGFYTKQNRALSFGWDLTNEGEVPWAGKVISYDQIGPGCGAILLTEEHLITPCNCVRTYLFKSAGKKDPEYATVDRSFYYESDQGEEIYVVVDTIQFHYDLLETKAYPKINGVQGDKLCFDAWEIGSDTYIDHYLGYYQPAVLKFSPAVSSGADGPWPPSPIYYDNGPFMDTSISDDYIFFSMKDNTTYGAHCVSFNFRPYERDVKSWDNFNREIDFENRQIELYVQLCPQTRCAFVEEFNHLNKFLHDHRRLQTLLCWCDDPERQHEVMFQNWKQAKVPHFLSSVFGGLPGSPIIHKGGLIGWELGHVEYGLRHEGQRATLSRGLDGEMIDYINDRIPKLAKGNRPNVHDRNRPRFAIRDQKLFLPDPDLTVEDVDLLAWSLQGVSLGHGQPHVVSFKESISPRLTLLLCVSAVQYFTAHQ